MAVSMISLVGAGDVAQESCRAFAGDSSFGDPGDGGGVVGAITESGALHFMVVGHDMKLAK